MMRFTRIRLAAVLGVPVFVALAWQAWPALSAAMNVARLTDARAHRAFGGIHPRISPRGDLIALSYQGSIFIMPREGGSMSRMTAGAGFDIEPCWSADGKSIAYVDSTDHALHIIDAAKGTSRKVITGKFAMGGLALHPDGKRAFGTFYAPKDVYQNLLAILDLETGQLDQFPMSPNGSALALSPDGSRVVFATTRDLRLEQGGNFGPDADIWVMSTADRKPAKIASTRARVYQMWWGAGNIIYFSTDLGGSHNDLWSLPLDDPNHAHKLTSGQGDEDYPSVSADGRYLVFTDNRESATAVVVRDLENGTDKLAIPTRLDFGVPTGTLQLTVIEKGSHQPLTARLSVQQMGGRSYEPMGALYGIAGKVEYFYAEREATLVVPAGRYVVRGFRGLEYLNAEQEIEVARGQTADATVEMERWTNPASQSLWSGESHIHANYGRGEWYNTPATMRRQIEGEGLNAANLVVANNDGDAVYDREFFRGEPDPASGPTTSLYWNEEFRATLWGHMTFYNLKQLVEPIFTGFAATTNPWDVPTNSGVADHVHMQGGYVNYTHVANSTKDPFAYAYSGKSLPIDIALGKIDSMDINASYQASVPFWYHILNCGFRLAASAGTDVFLNRLRSGLPGKDRAYAKIDGPFSYAAWAKQLKDGRAFVTNGPMLELAVGGRSPGDVLALAKGADVPVKAVATSPIPIDRVELIYNGEIAATGTLLPDRQSAIIEKPVWLGASGWVSLRAYAGNTQAHTSAVYMEVGGKRHPGFRKDAAYFVTWIDRLEAKLNERNRLPDPAAKAYVASQVNSARAIYKNIVERGL